MSDYESVWRAFESNEVTHSTAHYLLAIHSLVEAEEAPRAADLARALEVSRAAVSSRLKSLEEQGLVYVDGEHRLGLTEQGKRIQARIASKRQVLRYFFEEILGIPPETAETDACKIEHLISEESCAGILRLVRFLHSADQRSRGLAGALSDSSWVCSHEEPCEFCTGICLLEEGDPTSGLQGGEAG